MVKHNKKNSVEALPSATPHSATQQQPLKTDLGRGTINHSALGALVTSKVFRMRVEKVKKGKGSFNRKTKHSGKECYQIAA
jgi:alternative ribosome-rescue factor